MYIFYILYIYIFYTYILNRNILNELRRRKRRPKLQFCVASRDKAGQ